MYAESEYEDEVDTLIRVHDCCVFHKLDIQVRENCGTILHFTILDYQNVYTKRELTQYRTENLESSNYFTLKILQYIPDTKYRNFCGEHKISSLDPAKTFVPQFPHTCQNTPVSELSIVASGPDRANTTPHT